MKRIFDFIAALIGVFITAPVILPMIFLVWFKDRHSPFFIAPRAGKDGKIFHMIKLRSMIVDAYKAGINSTANSDPRITSVGYTIRRYKLDELPQLLNVLKGDMSLVGPRPNVISEIAHYTLEEKKLLTVKPGITDFASIVFYDEGTILNGADNPDLAYDQLIRPWKSRLGIAYIENRSFLIDIEIILVTILAIINRRAALVCVQTLLRHLGVDETLVRMSGRQENLTPFPPPGMLEIVKTRHDIQRSE